MLKLLINFFRNLFKREYGQFAISKIYDNNILCDGYKKDGYYETKIKFELKLIKSAVFKVRLKKNNSFSLNKDFLKDIPSLKEGNLHGMSFITNIPIKVVIIYEDRFNNKYKQIINIIPNLVKNGKLIPFNIKISNRRWLVFFYNNIFGKYLK